MEAAKSEAPITNVKVNTNLGLTNLNRVPLSLGASKEEAFKVSFNFSCVFEPNLGHITLEGFLVYIDNKDAMANIEKGWKKDKKLPKDLNQLLMNQIHTKSTIQAIILTKEIGLPPPLMMPRLSFDEKAK